MKKRLIALATLLPALMLSLTTMAGPREDEGWEKIADGALLVDVRSEQEFASGHLDGALLIPYEEVVAQFAARNIPKDQPVVLYCRSGNRAGVAERALREAGYTELFNAGGFTAMAANKPAEQPATNATDATACTPTSSDPNC